MNQQVLYLMCGLPGSGKSTYRINNFNGLCIISTDGIRKELFGSEFIQKQNTMVFKIAEDRINSELLSGRSCVFDATNIRVFDRKKFIDIAKRNHARIVCIWLDVDIEVAKQRNLDRKKKGGRFVPMHVIERMNRSFIEPTYNEGFDEIVRVN